MMVVCANNMVYGMTGGQAAPTTPAGSRSATTPEGNPYRPFDLCRLVKAAGAGYVARGSVTRPYDLMTYISRALESPGFTFVEALSPCPTQYGRRNRLDTVAMTYDRLGEVCMSRTEIDLSAPVDEEILVLGEFSDE